MERMAPSTQVDQQMAELRERVVTNIKVMQVRKRVSGRALCERLGVAHNWLSKRNNGVQPFTLEDLAAIARELDTTLGVLLGIETRPLAHPIAQDVDWILSDESAPRKFRNDFLGMIGHAVAMFLWATSGRTPASAPVSPGVVRKSAPVRRRGRA
jgi:transcriptional regulator with XRE-family HTH domain